MTDISKHLNYIYQIKKTKQSQALKYCYEDLRLHKVDEAKSISFLNLLFVFGS
jgi:hypothetical protein